MDFKRRNAIDRSGGANNLPEACGALACGPLALFPEFFRRKSMHTDENVKDVGSDVRQDRKLKRKDEENEKNNNFLPQQFKEALSRNAHLLP